MRVVVKLFLKVLKATGAGSVQVNFFGFPLNKVVLGDTVVL